MGDKPSGTVNLGRVKRLPLAAALLASVLAFSACGDSGPAGSRPAASVGDRTIETAEVTEAFEKFEDSPGFDQLSQQQGESQARRLFEQSYVSQLIRRYVLRAEAEEMNIDISDDQLSARLEEIKAQFQGDETAFLDALKQQGLTEAELDELVTDQLIEQELRKKVTGDLTPSDQELRAYYEDHLDDYKEVRASHILVEEMALAENLSDQLEAAPKGEMVSLFGRLAAKESTEPNAKESRGDLGWASPSNYVVPFANALEELEIGEISGPVQTEFGFHLIRLTGRRTRPFGAAKAEIAQTVGGSRSDKAWQEYLVEAYESAGVEVNPRYGEFDLETQQVVNATAEDVPGAEEGGGGP